MWVNSDTQAVSWVCHCWSVERQSATINWQPAIHIRFIPVSACCLTCALWPSGLYKPRMWCFLCVRRGYSGETGTLMTCDKGAQSWPSLKLSSLFFSFFTSVSLSVSELTWQQLCGGKTLQYCFSMSLWSTVIQPWPLLPIVISCDFFNMLVVSKDSAHCSSDVKAMNDWCHRFFKVSSTDLVLIWNELISSELQVEDCK